jgi:TPP-dependent pyruvate/acetoin dehydrogenase alpha subunit
MAKRHAQSGAPETSLPEERRLDLYYRMKLCRAVDDRLEILYRQGRIPGAVYSGKGQEGTHVGVTSALLPEDVLACTHRDLSAQLCKGLSLRRVFAQFFGKADGPTRGRDANSHVGDLDVGTFTAVSMLPSEYPLAVGAALAFQMRHEQRVAMAICGEGATANGTWHESLNLGAVWRLPVVFVVNNNQWAYSTRFDKHSPVPEVAARAAAYGIPGVRVDGTDVTAVAQAAAEAAERARGGGGPTLIESVSFRWRGHAGHDPAKYVPAAMRAEWEQRDPVAMFEARLLEQGVLTPERVEETEARIKAQIEDAIAFGKESPMPDPLTVEEGVFHE